MLVVPPCVLRHLARLRPHARRRPGPRPLPSRHLGQSKPNPQLMVQGAQLIKTLIIFVFGAGGFVERKQPVDQIVSHDRFPVAVITEIPWVFAHFGSHNGEGPGGELIPGRADLTSVCRVRQGVGDDIVVLARRRPLRDPYRQLVHNILRFQVVDRGEVDEDVAHRGERHGQREEAKDAGDGQGADNGAIDAIVVADSRLQGNDGRYNYNGAQ